MFLVVLEASLLGSGQILHLGGQITMKMALFTISILYTVFSMLCGERISLSTVLLLSYLLLLLSASTLIGLVKGAQPHMLEEDISQALYMLILPFFEITMRSTRDVIRVFRIILVGSLIIAVGYVIVMGALWVGSISTADVYRALQDKSDFMYDAADGRLFYKGSLYLGVAVIIFAFGRGRRAKVGLCITFATVLLTMTRGLLLALVSSFLIYVLVRPARVGLKVLYILSIVTIGGLSIIAILSFAGDKSGSDNDRRITINQVLDEVGPVSAIVGHGFGIGVPERPEHMEIAYLEIIHKQGVLGMVWIGYLCVVLIQRFRRAIKQGSASLAYPLLLSAVFVFVESMTNPFIDNPIGLSVIVIALAGLRAISVTQDGSIAAAT